MSPSQMFMNEAAPRRFLTKPEATGPRRRSRPAAVLEGGAREVGVSRSKNDSKWPATLDRSRLRSLAPSQGDRALSPKFAWASIWG